MRTKIFLTPEWVFTETGTTNWADGNGNAKISTQSKGIANLLCLTLDSLEISYKQEYFTDGYFNWYHRFVFRIEELMNECPELCSYLDEINNRLKKK